LLPVDFRNLYFRAINVNLNLLINFPAIMQYIFLVYIQVGDPFACQSNNFEITTKSELHCCHADGFVAAT
jgi:hypothetical protein